MAVKTQLPRQSKQVLLSLLVLVFLSWLLLLGWSFSLWGFVGFDKAWQTLNEITTQQTAAVAEFQHSFVISPIKTWLTNLPPQALTQPIEKAGQFIQKHLSEIPANEQDKLNLLSDELLIVLSQWLVLGKLTTHLLGIKLMILFAATPLFALSLTAGLVDGFNQRAIRTASLGRESSFVFHQLKRTCKTGLLLLVAFWLALPRSLTPAFVFVPASLLVGVLVSKTTAHFKKFI